jgi:hypothetical protein
MVQSVVFDIGNRGQVCSCVAHMCLFAPVVLNPDHLLYLLFASGRPNVKLNFSQAESSRPKTQIPGILVTDAQGAVMSPHQNDLFMPPSPETSAALTLGTNVRPHLVFCTLQRI